MSINWNFDSNDYEEQSFRPIPVGDHRLRIQSAEEQVSRTQKQMIKLVLEVSGYNSTLWHFLVFLPDNAKLTNQKLGELWNSFGIPYGDFNLKSWVGRVGAAKIKHEDYEGQPSPRIAYFISKDRQEKLPAWKEPNGNSALTGNGVTGPYDPIDDIPEDLPWK